MTNANHIQCVVLAGGMGTRLKELTAVKPKSLLEISGRPFLDYQLQWLSKNGVKEVLLCLGHLGEQIEAYVRNGDRWNLEVKFCHEGEKRLGTAGALRYAHDQGLLKNSFLVTYGDSYLPISFRAVWSYFQSTPQDALMVVFKNDGLWDRSNVEFDGKMIKVYDKSGATKHTYHYIDYGLSAMRRSVISNLIEPSKFVDLANVLHQMSLENKLAGFEVNRRFYEIGSLSGLKDFESFIQSKTIEVTDR